MFDFSSTWFLEGFWQPLQTPAHIILMLGIGLLLGQQGSKAVWSGWLGLAPAVLSGFALNHYAGWRFNYEVILLALTLLAGILLVLRLQLPPLLLLLLAVISGVFLGLDSQPVMIPGMASITVSNWLLGAGLVITGLVLVLALLALLLRPLWHGIILRVLGSWVGASAVMVLAFSFTR